MTDEEIEKLAEEWVRDNAPDLDIEYLPLNLEELDGPDRHTYWAGFRGFLAGFRACQEQMRPRTILEAFIETLKNTPSDKYQLRDLEGTPVHYREDADIHYEECLKETLQRLGISEDAKKREWISVNDQIPELGQPVLVYNRKHAIHPNLYILWLESFENREKEPPPAFNYFWTDDGIEECDEPDYWMPLPEAPEVEK